jgi:hypothetical protein
MQIEGLDGLGGADEERNEDVLRDADEGGVCVGLHKMLVIDGDLLNGFELAEVLQRLYDYQVQFGQLRLLWNLLEEIPNIFVQEGKDFD